MILIKNKTIGIIGYGIVGKSALNLISSFSNKIYIIDKKDLKIEQLKEIDSFDNSEFLKNYDPIQLFKICDYVIASPGVNLFEFEEYKNKLLCELDIFSLLVKTPVIAITGSLGKTSVTKITSDLLNLLGKKSIAAGNIGKAMLEIISIQEQFDFIILELSSFQLEYSKLFCPYISVITNIFENHLDRHKTIENYILAKSNIFQNQKQAQKIIIHENLIEKFNIFFNENHNLNVISNDELLNIKFVLSDATLYNNWQIIFKVLNLINFSNEQIIEKINLINPIEHRIEFVKKINGITFINDSKSTIAESTFKAIEKFQNKLIILFLGGVSKGKSRHQDFLKLPKSLKHVICFGSEANDLQNSCKVNSIESSSFECIKKAFDHAIEIAQPNDIILFSPGGSSFDLFENFEHRGKVFKDLVLNLK